MADTKQVLFVGRTWTQRSERGRRGGKIYSWVWSVNIILSSVVVSLRTTSFNVKPPYVLPMQCVLRISEQTAIISPYSSRLRFKYDSTRAETKFRLSAKRTNPFK
jgi:hypothetical protein